VTDESHLPEQLPLTQGHRMLRFTGIAVLTCCAVMFVLGYTVLEDQLNSFLAALYWLCCFLFAVAALIIALLDFSLVRRAFRKGKRQLIDEQFRAIEELESSSSDEV